MVIDATVAPKVGFISPFGTAVCNVNHINAAAQPCLKAEAQRTLEGVGCSRLFGKALASCESAHGVPHNAYWITSSARRSREGGIVIPSALAVLRLMISSNFIGCSTGRSAGLVPFRILSTKMAERRHRAAGSAP
jgi:hypothetical protein